MYWERKRERYRCAFEEVVLCMIVLEGIVWSLVGKTWDGMWRKMGCWEWLNVIRGFGVREWLFLCFLNLDDQVGIYVSKGGLSMMGWERE